MDDAKNALVAAPEKAQPLQFFSTIQGFEDGQRICKALAASNMVPKTYFQDDGQPRYGDMMLALDMANRTGASPLMIMQNLHVIQGRPSWSSSFIIAAINASGKVSPLRYKIKDLGEKVVEYTWYEWNQQTRKKDIKKSSSVKIHDRECIAWARDAHGDALEGPRVSIEMAVKEGWYTKNDSKWQTMPDLMLTYRAAAFFGRTYFPEMLMGLPATEEVQDVEYIDVTPATAATAPEPQHAETLAEPTAAKRTRAKAKAAEEPAPTVIDVEPVAAPAAAAEPATPEAAPTQAAAPAPAPTTTAAAPAPAAAEPPALVGDDNPFNFGGDE